MGPLLGSSVPEMLEAVGTVQDFLSGPRSLLSRPRVLIVGGVFWSTGPDHAGARPCPDQGFVGWDQGAGRLNQPDCKRYFCSFLLPNTFNILHIASSCFQWLPRPATKILTQSASNNHVKEHARCKLKGFNGCFSAPIKVSLMNKGEVNIY